MQNIKTKFQSKHVGFIAENKEALSSIERTQKKEECDGKSFLKLVSNSLESSVEKLVLVLLDT